MTDRTIFQDDVVVKKGEGGFKNLGVVELVGGIEDSDDSSDSESESSSSSEVLEKGFVRVSWGNKDRSYVVAESELEVVDRCFLPRDIVRTKDGKQLGTAISTKVTCDVIVAGTSKALKGINVSNLVPIEAFDELDYVTYGPWLGRVTSTYKNLLLKFSNEARGKLDCTTAEEDELLLDAYPQRSLNNPNYMSLFYPGQLLIGRGGKAFKDIKWISENRIKFRRNVQYKVLVEQVELYGVKVRWSTRAFPKDEGNTDEPANGPTDLGLKKADDGTSVDPEPEIPTVDKHEENPAEPPPEEILNEKLKGLKSLDHFWEGHVWIGDRFLYRLIDEEARLLNNQVDKTSKKQKKKKLAKRMEQKLHQSTSDGALEMCKTRKRKNRKKQQDAVSKADDSDCEISSQDENNAYNGHDDSEYEDIDGIPASAGSCASMPKESESEIEVLVNNESDLNVTSPIGQIPTILGTLSCRVDKFELDFTFIEESGIHAKKRFQCNIQNPECSKHTIERIGKEFQSFMKSMLKRNKQSLGTTSCAVLMARCPAAIRSFISKQSSLGDHEIFYEYMVDGKLTSGYLDKEGNKVDIEYQNDNQQELDMVQVVQLYSPLYEEGTDFVLTSAPPCVKQGGPNVKFHGGQWVTLQIAHTYTKVDIQWQNAVIENAIDATKLLPAHHIDDNDFCPGDFVIDKRIVDLERASVYGVVLKVDSQNRMAEIQWMKDGKQSHVEEVSSYEIADHEEFEFRISDVILRITNKFESVVGKLTDDQSIGELLRVTEKGFLEVLWANDTVALVHPLDVLNQGNGDDSDVSVGSEEEDDDASWTTASSGESEIEEIGDAEHPEPVENNDNNQPVDVSNEHGEGAIQNPDPAISDINPASANSGGFLNFVKDITDAICTNAIDEIKNEIDSSELLQKGSSSMDYKSSDIKKEANYTIVEFKNINSNGLDENDNAAHATNKLVQSDSKEISDDVTATVSSSSSADVSPVGYSTVCMVSSAPASHHFIQRYFDDASTSKIFLKAVVRDLKLLRSLPPGITVKSYEDRMDLLSVLIEGPTRTPYEDGIFSFDIYLPNNYPDSPPSVHYISFSPRLNPNLYETGRVCVSLLGTWSGKGSERWTKDSTVLQVLLSIQGLILNGEPYYNEAGYEGHKGTAEGMLNSRCYNEMVILRLVQHMTSVLQNPPEAFVEEVKDFCTNHISSLVNRVKKLTNRTCDNKEDEKDGSAVDQSNDPDVGFPLLPLSKGVVLSLRSRLDDLEAAATKAGYM